MSNKQRPLVTRLLDAIDNAKSHDSVGVAKGSMSVIASTQGKKAYIRIDNVKIDSGVLTKAEHALIHKAVREKIAAKERQYREEKLDKHTRILEEYLNAQ